jgi:hypothetical protein
MNTDDLIWTASVAIGKKIPYETLLYSDYMYGYEHLIDDVWHYVDECDAIGQTAWKKKYSQHKLYI